MKTVTEKISFAKGIDFDGIFAHAEKMAGTKLTFTEPKVKEVYEEVYIDFQSQDIKETCGVFAKALKSCVVSSCDNKITEDKTGELFYWVCIDIAYEHRSGGNNGMELFKARYKAGEWSFSN